MLKWLVGRIGRYHWRQFMKIRTTVSTLSDTNQAVEECVTGLGILSEELSWLLFFYTEGYNSTVVAEKMAVSFNGTPLHGGTSCQGVMSNRGFHSEQNRGMGLLAISDPQGSYGVGAADIGEDPRGAASAALEDALENAMRVGEIPDLVWMNAAPGCEEELIKGIEDVIGSDVPVAGGSAADNTVAGNWHQIARNRVYSNGVVISVFFPSVKLSYAFHSGYDPTDLRGKVTKARGRTISEIDGRPAAVVYNEWTDGLIEDAIPNGGNVLEVTTLAPVGREVGRVEGVSYFKLSHPERIAADGTISFFTDFVEGDEIVLMAGSRNSLIARAGRVTQAAISAGGFAPAAIAGAVCIYCAGCMLTVREDMAKVAEEINLSLSKAPFFGVFTFGEQGCFVGHENSHGNLMISVVVFSNEPVV